MSYKVFNSVDVDNASIFEASNYKAMLADIIDIPRTPTVAPSVDRKEYHRQYVQLNRELLNSKGRERYHTDEEAREIILKRSKLNSLISFFRKYYNDPDYGKNINPRTGLLRGKSIRQVCKEAGCSYSTLARFYSYGWVPKVSGNNKSIVYTDKHVRVLKDLVVASSKLHEPVLFKKGIMLKPLIDELHRNWN